MPRSGGVAPLKDAAEDVRAGPSGREGAMSQCSDTAAVHRPSPSAHPTASVPHSAARSPQALPAAAPATAPPASTTGGTPCDRHGHGSARAATGFVDKGGRHLPPASTAGALHAVGAPSPARNRSVSRTAAAASDTGATVGVAVGASEPLAARACTDAPRRSGTMRTSRATHRGNVRRDGGAPLHAACRGCAVTRFLLRAVIFRMLQVARRMLHAEPKRAPLARAAARLVFS